MTEDDILIAIDIERALAMLSPRERMMMEIISGYLQPEDWDMPWPARFEDIGRYIGLKFDGKVISEATVRYRRDQVKAMWRGERQGLRVQRRRRDL